MNASVSIKTEEFNEEQPLHIIIFKLFVILSLGLAVLVVFYSRKIKRLKR